MKKKKYPIYESKAVLMVVLGGIHALILIKFNIYIIPNFCYLFSKGNNFIRNLDIDLT